MPSLMRRDHRRREALERLVEQQQLRVEGERAGDRDHLALAARELVAAARHVLAQLREHLVGEIDARLRVAASGRVQVGSSMFSATLRSPNTWLSSGE
jgi:hypothetical protein